MKVEMLLFISYVLVENSAALENIAHVNLEEFKRSGLTTDNDATVCNSNTLSSALL